MYMKQLFYALLLLCVSFISYSQTDDEIWTKELGISLGAMNCNTDIGGLPMDMHSFKLGGGIYFGLSYLQKIGFRLEGTLGTVTASDTRATKNDLRRRNLNFTSGIKNLLLAMTLPGWRQASSYSILSVNTPPDIQLPVLYSTRLLPLISI